MEFLGNVFHAFTSPINCAAELGANLLTHVSGDVVQFVRCVASNLNSFGG